MRSNLPPGTPTTADRVKLKVKDILDNPPDPIEEAYEFGVLAGQELYGFGEAAVDVAADIVDLSPPKK